MRMSQLFLRTLREAPAEAEIASHRLLLRAGMIHQVASGIFDLLPLGLRVMRKVEAILRQEMDAIGGQEVSLPMVQPADLWRRTGRWDAIGPEMARLTDAAGRDLCLGMTHEEVITDLAAATLSSYRQLPVMLYQIQTKFRDETRSRGGLIRVREFAMKDGYSFHADAEDLDRYYPLVHAAYHRAFRRCGLSPIDVESDTGLMGGSQAHEFMALTEVGEDTLILCDACGYRANRQVAAFRKDRPAPEPALELERVATPGTTTIQALATLLGVPTSATAKAVFLVAEGVPAAPIDGEPASGPGPDRFVFAVVRGDMDVNETKLAAAIGARALRPARTEEIAAVGAVAGYASPIGIWSEGALVVADDLIPDSPNLVVGANLDGFHLRNSAYGRDWSADVVADIASAEAGLPCVRCGQALRAERGVEVGNIFKLGTRYSEALGALYDAEDGARRPMVMGCYGIGVGRLAACVVEASHDEAGIVWPMAIAPYQVHLVSLARSPGDEVAIAAEALSAGLQAAGIEVLLDDRAERPGVKFADADLIGIPIRLTLGARGLASGTVERRRRRDGDASELPLDGAAPALLAEIRSEVAAGEAADD